jgi:hypothetical protein
MEMCLQFGKLWEQKIVDDYLEIQFPGPVLPETEQKIEILVPD